ncbi:hypothetical protein LguiB_028693 [Lonicera macranthoides]
MATSLALKRTTTIVSTLFNRFLLNPNRSSASFAPPSFSTSAQMARSDDDDEDNDFASNFISDVFDPLSPTRSLRQVLNLMDQFMDSPLMAAASHGIGFAAGSRRGWDVKEDKEGLHIRVDMPGLDKKNIKISVEQNILIIKGEGEKESDEEEDYGRRYSSRLVLPMDLYKINETKAEMKNGVLKLRVPKVKEEERKDVFQVKVD